MNKQAKTLLKQIAEWDGIDGCDVNILMDRFRENPSTDALDIDHMEEIVRDLAQGVWNYHVEWSNCYAPIACDAWQNYIIYGDRSRGYEVTDQNDCHFTPFLIENASDTELLDMWGRRIDEEHWCEFDVYEEFEEFRSADLRAEIGTELWDALKAYDYSLVAPRLECLAEHRALPSPDLTLAPKLRDALQRTLAKSREVSP